GVDLAIAERENHGFLKRTSGESQRPGRACCPILVPVRDAIREATTLMLRNRWSVLALICFARVSMGFQFQAIAALAPLLMAAFGLSYRELGTVIGLFMLPGAFFALPGGLLGARFGDKAVVQAGLALM